MRQLFSALIAVSALFLAASDAFAGGSLKDTVPLAAAGRCVGGAFSGAYAGIQLGGGSMNSHQSTPATVEGEPAVLSFSDDGGGFTIGGHSGYNVQCGRVLFGIESDISYFGASTRSVLDEECDECVEDQFATFKSELNWFGTLRGRLGLVQGEKFLVYATGGLAYADVDHTFSDTSVDFSQSNSKTQFGWTVGGGVEFLRDTHWSLRADALYVDLGSEGRTYTVADDGCEGPCTARVHWDDNFWVARVGLTYHFGAPEPVVVPLK